MFKVLSNFVTDFKDENNFKDAIKFQEIGIKLVNSHSEFKNDFNLVNNF